MEFVLYIRLADMKGFELMKDDILYSTDGGSMRVIANDDHSFVGKDVSGAIFHGDWPGNWRIKMKANVERIKNEE